MAKIGEPGTTPPPPPPPPPPRGRGGGWGGGGGGGGGSVCVREKSFSRSHTCSGGFFSSKKASALVLFSGISNPGSTSNTSSSATLWTKYSSGNFPNSFDIIFKLIIHLWLTHWFYIPL